MFKKIPKLFNILKSFNIVKNLHIPKHYFHNIEFIIDIKHPKIDAAYIVLRIVTGQSKYYIMLEIMLGVIKKVSIKY